MRILAAALGVGASVAGAGAFAAGDLDAVLGRALFQRDWVTAGASTGSADGLGPLFSARSCAGCHSGPGLGARFTAIDGKVAGRGVVVRFGNSEGRPDPVYGTLLQNAGVAGLKPEGRIVLTAAAAGGIDTAVRLDRGPLDPAIHMGARLAPPLIGRAGLERIDTAAVLALADPDDRDGDGISGRARLVGGTLLGRYGWKAATADLEGQIADAFAHEMGLSSARRPLPYGDCTPGEPDCLAARAGAGSGGDELEPQMIDLVAAYVRALPQPGGTTALDPSFAAIGCAACHAPSLAAWGGGMVHAYSDLLLHDMGTALDDGVGEPGVASAEWRTAPLAGLGPQDGRRRYLHDGRAPTIDAAIRAHGGEAAAARDRYDALATSQRQALVAFLEGL